MTAFDESDASNPFDLRPDPELGHLLRDHLEPGGHAAFTARLAAAVAATAEARAVARRPGETSWDVLAAWARPGLAAAAVLAALLGGWLWRDEPGTAVPAPLAVATADDVPSMLPGELAALAGTGGGDVSVLMLEER